MSQKINLKVYLGSLLVFLSCSAVEKDETHLPYKIKDTIYNESFSSIDTSAWIVESEEEFELSEHISGDVLDIDVSKGFTLWSTTKFTGNVMFEFEATVIKNGGKNDRASDLNCFWMASDPEYPDDFFERSAWRKGIFYNYYSLKLYYVGYGGHDNTKTRFRKYNGLADPQPAVIKEYTDSVHLIKPNKKNVIRIVCLDNTVQYYFNDELLFELNDDNPYREGYFGFRTTNNHMQISGFRVHSIEKR